MTGDWQKSSFSFSNSNCVQARHGGGVVQLRDSKNPDGGTLSFAPAGWAAFIAAVKAG